jgi:hypothetical protein
VPGIDAEDATEVALLGAAVERCVEVAHERARDPASPVWISPSLVRGVLTRALAPHAERSAGGGGA